MIPQANEADKKLRNRALYYLAKREYSFHELVNKTLNYAEELGLNKKDCEFIISKLREQNLQSDQRFCESYINSKKNKFGAQKIVFELTQKGVSEDLVATFIGELVRSEYDLALQVWNKKYSHVTQDINEKAKQIRFLQSRGFSFETIKKIIK